MGADAPGLKPINSSALQASIEGLAKDLMLPGAMVLLSTPQGDVIFGYGTTELGAASPPRADTRFRAASNTKTMTAAAIVQMVQEGKLGFDDPISKYVGGVPTGTTSRSASSSRCGRASSISRMRRSSRRASTTIRTRSGPRTRSWAWRSGGRRNSRRAPSTRTTTPTTICSASSPRRSTASRSRRCSRTASSGRSA